MTRTNKMLVFLGVISIPFVILNFKGHSFETPVVTAEQVAQEKIRKEDEIISLCESLKSHITYCANDAKKNAKTAAEYTWAAQKCIDDVEPTCKLAKQIEILRLYKEEQTRQSQKSTKAK